MKREEKNQIMRRRILDSASHEFSEHGYGASSINNICSSEEISKGIVYHYFETKDDLYIATVTECFQKLTDYISNNYEHDNDSVDKHLKKYFSIRDKFFNKHPVYQRIFCEAVITPPSHLKERIKEIKSDFDNQNAEILKEILKDKKLRSDISMDQIIEIFRQFQDFINIRYQMTDINEQTFEAREENCLRALDVLLYGVIER